MHQRQHQLQQRCQPTLPEEEEQPAGANDVKDDESAPATNSITMPAGDESTPAPATESTSTPEEEEQPVGINEDVPLEEAWTPAPATEPANMTQGEE